MFFWKKFARGDGEREGSSRTELSLLIRPCLSIFIWPGEHSNFTWLFCPFFAKSLFRLLDNSLSTCWQFCAEHAGLWRQFMHSYHCESCESRFPNSAAGSGYARSWFLQGERNCQRNARAATLLHSQANRAATGPVNACQQQPVDFHTKRTKEEKRWIPEEKCRGTADMQK